MRDIQQSIKVEMRFKMSREIIKNGFDQAMMVQRFVAAAPKSGNEPPPPRITREQTMQVAPGHATIDRTRPLVPPL